MCSVPQVLQVRMSREYKVKDLLEDVTDWIEDEYLSDGVWKRLSKYLSSDLLPTHCETEQLGRNTKSRDDEAAGPSSVHTPAAAPSGVHTPSAAPSGVQTPTAAPSGVQTPAAAPCGVHTPAAAPCGVHTPATTPSGVHTPATTPFDVQTPAAAPSGVHTPVAAPSGAHIPAAPSSVEPPIPSTTAADNQGESRRNYKSPDGEAAAPSSGTTQEPRISADNVPVPGKCSFIP